MPLKLLTDINLKQTNNFETGDQIPIIPLLPVQSKPKIMTPNKLGACQPANCQPSQGPNQGVELVLVRFLLGWQSVDCWLGSSDHTMVSNWP